MTLMTTINSQTTYNTTTTNETALFTEYIPYAFDNASNTTCYIRMTTPELITRNLTITTTFTTTMAVLNLSIFYTSQISLLYVWFYFTSSNDTNDTNDDLTPTTPQLTVVSDDNDEINNCINQCEAIINTVGCTPLNEEYVFPDAKITSRIEIDDEDNEDNNTTYMSDRFQMTFFHCDGSDIDDIAFKGKCYVDTDDNCLYGRFFNNPTPYLFNNITYRQLLILATYTPEPPLKKVISPYIDLTNTLNDIQIVKIEYEY
jgi:hypothetical protein